MVILFLSNHCIYILYCFVFYCYYLSVASKDKNMYAAKFISKKTFSYVSLGRLHKLLASFMHSFNSDLLNPFPMH